MHNSMKINLIFFLPTFIFGGAGNSIYRLCSKLDKKKYNIYIISIGKCYFKKKLLKHCRKIYELKTSRTLFSLFMLRDIVSNIYKKFPQKTIFVSNQHYANLISLLSLRGLRFVKIILVDRIDIIELKRYYTFLKFLKNIMIYYLCALSYRYADAVVSNSKSAKKDLQKLCKTKVININPPSLLKLKMKKKRNIFKKKFKILTVGGLVKAKGVDTIIKAFKFIKLKNVSLKIIGEGNERKNLSFLIEKLKLKKKVHLIGWVNNTAKFYSESDLFLHASHQEGFPNSIVEAINYNLPVIATNCKGGTKEILLNGKGGDLFPVNSHKILTEKIDKFFDNMLPLNKKLTLARENIKNYSVDVNLYKYNKLFLKV